MNPCLLTLVIAFCWTLAACIATLIFRALARFNRNRYEP